MVGCGAQIKVELFLELTHSATASLVLDQQP